MKVTVQDLAEELAYVHEVLQELWAMQGDPDHNPELTAKVQSILFPCDEADRCPFIPEERLAAHRQKIADAHRKALSPLLPELTKEPGPAPEPAPYVPVDCLYDPPTGWAYDFPKPWPNNLPFTSENLEKQLVADGYPEVMAKDLVKYTRLLSTKENP